MSHPIVPRKTYIKVFIGLLFLTLLTVLVAKPVSGFDAGFLNTFIAFFIASVKAALVALFFMQLKYENKTLLIIFISGFFFLILMIFFILFDIFTRVIPSHFAS